MIEISYIGAIYSAVAASAGLVMGVFLLCFTQRFLNYQIDLALRRKGYVDQYLVKELRRPRMVIVAKFIGATLVILSSVELIRMFL